MPGGWWEEEDDDTADQMSSLQGQLLVASPNIGDERFEKTVILMCHHDPESAMGLVINRPANSLNLGDLYEKLDIGAARFCAANPVHIGGLSTAIAVLFSIHRTICFPKAFPSPMKSG